MLVVGSRFLNNTKEAQLRCREREVNHHFLRMHRKAQIIPQRQIINFSAPISGTTCRAGESVGTFASSMCASSHILGIDRQDSPAT